MLVVPPPPVEMEGHCKSTVEVIGEGVIVVVYGKVHGGRTNVQGGWQVTSGFESS